MIVEQTIYKSYHEKEVVSENNINKDAQLILVFGTSELVCDNRIFDDMRISYPNSYIMGCSASGEIYNDQANDRTLVATAIYLEKSDVRCMEISLPIDDPVSVVQEIQKQLPFEGLKQVLILSVGMKIDASNIISFIQKNLPENVIIAGGLASDNINLQKTYVIADGYAKDDCLVLAGFYGDDLQIGHRINGGFNSFGIERLITKSDKNILYELDGKPALSLYKDYLGHLSQSLPLSALNFPLNIRSKDKTDDMIRGVCSIDENTDSLIFSSQVPEGYYAKLMTVNSNMLIDGAEIAVTESMKGISGVPDLVLAISCFGRRMIMKDLSDEEINVIRDTVGKCPVITGFYSSGEFGHSSKNSECYFQNQMISLVIFREGR